MVSKNHLYIAIGLIALSLVGGLVLAAYVSSSNDVAGAVVAKQLVTEELSKLQDRRKSTDEQATKDRAAIDELTANAKTLQQQVDLLSKLAGTRTTPTIVQVPPASRPAVAGASRPALGKPAGRDASTAGLETGATSVMLDAEQLGAVNATLAAGKKCGIDLSACQSDLKDADNQKELLHERAERAEKVLKGGGFWRRLKTSAKWFAIGGTVAGAALCGTGHCR